MLSRPRKPPSKTLLPCVLAVDPPGEVQQQLVEDALEELDVALAGRALLDRVDEQRGPGVHGRVDVAEVPLVGGDLAVGVQVALAQHQFELLLGEVGIDQRPGQAVEGQVPGGEPGVLPLVGHRDDVVVDHVEPVRGCGAGRSAAPQGRRRARRATVDVVE